QRLQPLRPHLDGAHAGREPVPRLYQRHQRHLRPQLVRRDDAHGLHRRGAARRRPGPPRPLHNHRAVSINGGPSPGHGPGEAIAAMESVAKSTLPAGFSYEWTGQALEQIQSAGQAPIVLGLAVVFAYLFLVGLYESWTVPIPVHLSVTVARLAALLGRWLVGLRSSLYPQVGIGRSAARLAEPG